MKNRRFQLIKCLRNGRSKTLKKGGFIAPTPAAAAKKAYMKYRAKNADSKYSLNISLIETPTGANKSQIGGGRKKTFSYRVTNNSIKSLKGGAAVYSRRGRLLSRTPLIVGSKYLLSLERPHWAVDLPVTYQGRNNDDPNNPLLKFKYIDENVEVEEHRITQILPQN